MSPEVRSHMTPTDRLLSCRDCYQDFVFTVGEQEFYASRHFTHPPSRCPFCRALHKRQAAERSRNTAPVGSREVHEARRLYGVICAQCGNQAQVPFQPEDDRPVYCSACYQARRGDRTSDRRPRWSSC